MRTDPGPGHPVSTDSGVRDSSLFMRGQTPVRMNRHDRRALRGGLASARQAAAVGGWPSTRRSTPRPPPQADTCGSTGAAGGASMPPGSSLPAGPFRSSGTGCWPKGLRGAPAAACRAPRGPRWQSGFPALPEHLTGGRRTSNKLPSVTRGRWPRRGLFEIASGVRRWVQVAEEPRSASSAVRSSGLPRAGASAASTPLGREPSRHAGRRLLLNVAGLLLIGLVWLPFNPGGVTFFVYGSAFVGHAVPPPPAYACLAAIAVLVAFESLVLDLPPEFLLFGAPVAVVVGAATIHFAEAGRQESALRLSQAEVRRLAAVASAIKEPEAKPMQEPRAATQARVARAGSGHVNVATKSGPAQQKVVTTFSGLSPNATTIEAMKEGRLRKGLLPVHQRAGSLRRSACGRLTPPPGSSAITSVRPRASIERLSMRA